MRYYFHVLLLEGQVDDQEGNFFDDASQATQEAKIALHELATRALIRGGESLSVRGIKVSTDQGETAVIMVDPAVEKALRARR